MKNSREKLEELSKLPYRLYTTAQVALMINYHPQSIRSILWKNPHLRPAHRAGTHMNCQMRWTDSEAKRLFEFILKIPL